MASEIDSLQIRIVSESTNAAQAIDKLSASLKKLSAGKKANDTIAFLSNLGNSLSSLNAHSSSIQGLEKIVTAMNNLASVGSLAKATNGLSRIAPALESLRSVDVAAATEKLQTLTKAMSGISELKGLSGFASSLRALKDLPEITKSLSPEILDAFTERVKRVSEAVTPLSNKMTTVAQGFRAINEAAKPAADSVENVNKQLNKISLVSAIQGAGTIYNFFKTVTNLVNKLTDEVIDLDGIIERFNRGFGEYGQEAYQWIERLNKEMGLNIQYFMQYTSIFSQMLEGLGVAQKDAAQMAIGYSELAYDIWAAYNDIYQSYGDAVSAVQSGIAGQTRPLRRAGFSVLNTTLQQTAANHGLTISVQNATEAEKSYLRYLALVDQAHAQGIVGTYAKEMNTAEGMLRTLGQQMKSLSHEAGNLLLPLITIVVPRVQAAVRIISGYIKQLAALFGVTLRTPEWDTGVGGFTEALEDAEDASDGIAAGVGGAAASAKELKKTLLGIDEINQLNGQDKSSGGGGGGGGASASGIGSGLDWDVSSLWTEAIFKDINRQVDEIEAKFRELIPVLEYAGLIAGGIGLALLLNDLDKSVPKMTDLQKWAIGVAAAVVDIALNIAFTEVVLSADSADASTQIVGLLGEWLASAGAGLVIGKVMGNTTTGLAIGLSIGAVIQIATLSFELARGNTSITDSNFWAQEISSLLMGGLAGFALLGGPTGLVIGLIATLAIEVIGFAIAWENGGRAEAEMKKMFGSIHLTEEEIELEVERLKWSAGSVVIDGNSVDIYSATQMVVDARIDAQKAAMGINASLAEVEQNIGKLKLGIDGSTEALKGSVDAWLENIANYIESSEKASLITNAIFGVSNTDIGQSTQAFYDGMKSQYQKYADELQALLATETASNPLGLVGHEFQVDFGVEFSMTAEDKAEAIAEVVQKLQDILAEAARLDYEAQIIQLRLDTKDMELDSDSWQAIFDRITEINNAFVDNMSEVEKEFIKSLLISGLSEDEALKEAELARLQLTLETSYGTLSDSLSILTDHFGNELDSMFETISLHMQDTDFWDSLFTTLANEGGTSLTQWANSMSSTFASNKAVADIASSILKQMEPQVSQWQSLFKIYKDNGEQIPVELRNALTDTAQLGALKGDVNSILFLIGTQFSNSPEFYEMLAKTEGAFEGVDQSVIDGLYSNIAGIRNTAEGIVITTSEGIEYKLGELTPTMEDNFEKLGIKLPEGFESGYDEGLSVAFGSNGIQYRLKALANDKFNRVINADDYKPYGGRLLSGFKSGATPSNSEFDAQMNAIYNAARTASGRYLTKEEFVRYGQAIPEGIRLGVDRGNNISSHVSKILLSIDPDTSNSVKNMHRVGQNLVAGIIEGMRAESTSNNTVSKLKETSNNIKKTVEWFNKIDSPSKLYRDDVGRWLTAGIVEGMDQPEALVDPLKTMYGNAEDWWKSNTASIADGSIFSAENDTGKEHYMNLKDANNESNALLREQNELLRAILEKDTEAGYYGTTGEAMLQAASHLNRKTGRTMIPVGG